MLVPNRLLASIYVTTIIFTIFNLATYVRLNEIYTLSSLLFLIVVINVHCCFFYILTFKFTCLTSLFDRLMTINKLSVHSPDSVAGVWWYLGWKCFTAEWLENKYDCIFRLFCGLSYNARNCLIGRYLVCSNIGTKLAFDGHKTKKLMFLAFSVR